MNKEQKTPQPYKLQAIEKLGRIYLISGHEQMFCTEEIFVRDNAKPDYPVAFNVKVGEIINPDDVYLDRFCENEEWVTAYRVKNKTPQPESVEEAENDKHKLHSEMDKWVHSHLLSEGWEEDQFGVISAAFEGGTCNLTYVVSSVIEAWEAKQMARNGKLLESVEEAALLDAEDLGGDALAYFLTGFNRGAQWQRSQMEKWVKVEDRLPDRGMFTILVFGSYTADCPQRAMEVHYYRKGNRCEFRSMDGIKTKNVTHWQPLPNPPQQ